MLEFIELMGQLRYLNVYTRSDLSFALSYLLQFNSDPRVMHISTLKRIYDLKEIINYCLEFER